MILVKSYSYVKTVTVILSTHDKAAMGGGGGGGGAPKVIDISLDEWYSKIIYILMYPLSISFNCHLNFFIS